jgi:hypothetical protein
MRREAKPKCVELRDGDATTLGWCGRGIASVDSHINSNWVVPTSGGQFKFT